MSDTKIIFVALFALSFVASALGMLHVSRNSSSRFSVDDLLLDPKTGKADPVRVLLFGSFLSTTWMMGYLTVSAKLTEGYFAAYIGAWVAPVVAKIIWDKSPARDGESK